MALANAGCEIEAVCPSRNALATTKAVCRVYRYSGITPLSSLAAAITASRPDLIIPGDDLATRHLFDLSHRDRDFGGTRRRLIERSLGAPESYPLIAARAAFL